MRKLCYVPNCTELYAEIRVLREQMQRNKKKASSKSLKAKGKRLRRLLKKTKTYTRTKTTITKTYQPQGFGDLAWNIASREMSSYVSSHKEPLMKEIEALVLLLTSVQDSRSWKGVLAATLSYIKSHYSTSLSSVVIQCISDIFEINDIQSVFTVQAGEPDTPLEAAWLQTMRSVSSNWKLATQNEGFEKISKLLSLLIGAGIVNMTSLNPDVAGFQLFSEMSVPKHVSAFDITDALMSTVVFFVEGGYESFRSGSLKPLLYGEHDMRRFDDMYLTCRKYADFARPGNLALLSIDENDLEKLYSDTIELGKSLTKTVKSMMVKKQLQDRIAKLQDLHASFVQYRATGGIREKPYCVGIYGKSSVGKSTIGPLLMVNALNFNGFRCDDESMIVLNEHDKYMSNYKSSIQGVFLDDVGNTKADFVETAPTTRILELVNNVKMYANMAEADLKGKVSIQPKVVVCTTNVKDFCAHTYSNEPVSIARRANIILTATVKAHFATNNMLDERKVFEFYGENVPEIPDLWNFHVEKAYPVPNKTKGKPDDIGWKTIVWNGLQMSSVPIKTVLRFLNSDTSMHFAHQRKIVQNNSHLSEKLTFCSECRAHVELCVCSDPGSHDVNYVDSPYIPAPSQIGAKNRSRSNGSKNHPQKTKGKHTRQAGFLSALTWNDVYTRLDSFSSGWLYTIAAWSPTCIFENWYSKIFFAWLYGRFTPLAQAMLFILPVSGIAVLSCFTSLSVALFTGSSLYVFQWITELNTLVSTVRDTRLGTWMHRHEVSSKVKYILAGSALLSVAYYMCSNAQKTRAVFGAQGAMHPSMREIDERDSSTITDTIAEEMNWANVHITPVPVSHKSKTMTSSVLKTLTGSNMTFMETMKDGKRFGCDAFFVCSNLALIPRHAWNQDEMLCKFSRHDQSQVGGNFSSYVSRKHSVDIPGMDASLIWVANGGSWKDLRDFFPQELPSGNVPAEFMWKNEEGIIKTCQTLFKSGQASNGFTTFPGGHYMLNFPTRNGLCMAPLVSETKSPYYAAFHLGGVTGTPSGCGGTILRQQLDSAIIAIRKIPSVLVSASAGTMETEKYGVQFLESTSIHEKSPLNKLPMRDGKTPNIQIFGSCMGRVKYFSDVVQSHISEAVESVCDVPNKWGAPQFQKGHAWSTSLEHSSHPSHGMEGNLLSKACEDYLRPFKSLLEQYHALRTATRPLQKMEVICGIDGKKFVDKMPPRTSIGYPLSGAKLAFLTYLDPSLFEGYQCPAELDDMFWIEFEKAKDAYAKGERYYAAFKACLKDEPTKLSKDKVRVFQAAPIVLQMMTRKYFLPIARILSLFPALSECAVGVNCMGPDWDELGEHMRTFGKDRILAGDYSKYDLRMPAQVMFAAFRIMIEIARECDYTEEDITIMEGIATDICYPVMAYNGDLIQHIGSNPSGQNLTVYINSVVNSLLFRCAFYDQQGIDSNLDFRSICKLMTYGDDVKGSVKKGFDNFNHIYCADFFAKHDMKFTMPDKESTPTKFMSDADADFLKRKNVFCPELNTTMGALDEDSIFKSLHSNLKSKANTKEKLAADNIDGALREWFNHGRDKYESRRTQMQEVAKISNISHICTMLDTNFDTMCEKWTERYITKTESTPTPDDSVYDVQAGEFCGDELVPYAVSMYDHCNGSTGFFSVEDKYALYFHLLSLPIQFFIGRLFISGRLRFCIPTFHLYHKVLFMFLIWTAGVQWLYVSAFHMLGMIYYFSNLPNVWKFYVAIAFPDPPKKKYDMRANNRRIFEYIENSKKSGHL